MQCCNPLCAAGCVGPRADQCHVSVLKARCVCVCVCAMHTSVRLSFSMYLERWREEGREGGRGRGIDGWVDGWNMCILAEMRPVQWVTLHNIFFYGDVVC